MLYICITLCCTPLLYKIRVKPGRNSKSLLKIKLEGVCSSYFRVTIPMGRGSFWHSYLDLSHFHVFKSDRSQYQVGGVHHVRHTKNDLFLRRPVCTKENFSSTENVKSTKIKIFFISRRFYMF